MKYSRRSEQSKIVPKHRTDDLNTEHYNDFHFVDPFQPQDFQEIASKLRFEIAQTKSIINPLKNKYQKLLEEYDQVNLEDDMYLEHLASSSMISRQLLAQKHTSLRYVSLSQELEKMCAEYDVIKKQISPTSIAHLFSEVRRGENECYNMTETIRKYNNKFKQVASQIFSIKSSGAFQTIQEQKELISELRSKLKKQFQINQDLTSEYGFLKSLPNNHHSPKTPEHQITALQNSLKLKCHQYEITNKQYTHLLEKHENEIAEMKQRKNCIIRSIPIHKEKSSIYSKNNDISTNKNSNRISGIDLSPSKEYSKRNSNTRKPSLDFSDNESLDDFSFKLPPKIRKDEFGKRRIAIGLFNDKITESKIYSLFNIFGPIQDTQMINKPDSSMQYSLITFKNHEDAKKAISKMDGKVCEGFSLSVKWSKNQKIYSLPEKESIYPKTETKTEFRNISEPVPRVFSDFAEISDDSPTDHPFVPNTNPSDSDSNNFSENINNENDIIQRNVELSPQYDRDKIQKMIQQRINEKLEKERKAAQEKKNTENVQKETNFENARKEREENERLQKEREDNLEKIRKEKEENEKLQKENEMLRKKIELLQQEKEEKNEQSIPSTSRTLSSNLFDILTPIAKNKNEIDENSVHESIQKTKEEKILNTDVNQTNADENEKHNSIHEPLLPSSNNLFNMLSPISKIKENSNDNEEKQELNNTQKREPNITQKQEPNITQKQEPNITQRQEHNITQRQEPKKAYEGKAKGKQEKAQEEKEEELDDSQTQKLIFSTFSNNSKILPSILGTTFQKKVDDNSKVPNNKEKNFISSNPQFFTGDNSDKNEENSENRNKDSNNNINDKNTNEILSNNDMSKKLSGDKEIAVESSSEICDIIDEEVNLYSKSKSDYDEKQQNIFEDNTPKQIQLLMESSSDNDKSDSEHISLLNNNNFNQEPNLQGLQSKEQTNEKEENKSSNEKENSFSKEENVSNLSLQDSQQSNSRDIKENLNASESHHSSSVIEGSSTSSQRDGEQTKPIEKNHFHTKPSDENDDAERDPHISNIPCIISNLECLPLGNITERNTKNFQPIKLLNLSNSSVNAGDNSKESTIKKDDSGLSTPSQNVTEQKIINLKDDSEEIDIVSDDFEKENTESGNSDMSDVEDIVIDDTSDSNEASIPEDKKIKISNNNQPKTESINDEGPKPIQSNNQIKLLDESSNSEDNANESISAAINQERPSITIQLDDDTKQSQKDIQLNESSPEVVPALLLNLDEPKPSQPEKQEETQSHFSLKEFLAKLNRPKDDQVNSTKIDAEEEEKKEIDKNSSQKKTEIILIDSDTAPGNEEPETTDF